ncbi:MULTISPECIES: hypothetical protein [unclassified Bradyrhizobium]|uniref:hypothetical protein n=1 Tax=unclassified Bradyrhizobium TaxID=2631580 RepID=UPI001BA84611|nr:MULTISPECIES: hypothetical protein [unclassified Bradyrhizobium]MBR1208756.1 hypothetical protein [Bradyrhizobium sp. AUGA SZCCT0124]MBR1316949.1 hypothetical protein [Bradyrhizobium sp. AUGA SZCCT0051]MBR1345255.1 hypothetical protein [Bradyrhizobium sp. AUGA SZCCT0105]MBR1360043.1 hypothetical protein [Bradyrhizobium sp. AUGA SZCCT0045]
MIIAIITLTILLLLGTSVAVIAFKDPNKLWDHLARSLVQMGIAIASVFVAIELFQTQLQERDTQALQQQKLVVISFLQSKLLEVELAYRSKYDQFLLNADFIRCDKALKGCDFDRDRNIESREQLQLSRDLKNSDYSPPLKQMEVWTLMRSAPLIDQSYFKQLASAFGVAESSAAVMQRKLFEIEHPKPPPKSEFARAMASWLGGFDADYAMLALAQAEEIQSTLRAVCVMSQVMTNLDVAPRAVDDRSISCPPHSDAYWNFLASLEASSRRQLRRTTDGYPMPLDHLQPGPLSLQVNHQ